MKRILEIRHIFLTLLLSIALIASDALAGEKGDLNLFFTTDVHGYLTQCGCKVNPAGGLARRSGYINSIGANAPKKIVVDCGNFGSTMSEKEKSKVAYLLKGMAMIGYDAINLGEKDLQYGAEFLKSVQKEHSLPFISANVYDKNSGELFAKPFVIKKIDGIKVGIFGLETESANPRLAHFGFEVREPFVVATAMVEKLSKKCDVIIALAHIGLAKSKELASQVDGIDFIVSGYRWDKTYSPVKVGETVIMQTGTQGKNMGHITFNVDKDKTNLVAGKLVNLNSKIEEDEKLSKFVDAFEEAGTGKATGTN